MSHEAIEKFLHEVQKYLKDTNKAVNSFEQWIEGVLYLSGIDEDSLKKLLNYIKENKDEVLLGILLSNIDFLSSDEMTFQLLDSSEPEILKNALNIVPDERRRNLRAKLVYACANYFKRDLLKAILDVDENEQVDTLLAPIPPSSNLLLELQKERPHVFQELFDSLPENTIRNILALQGQQFLAKMIFTLLLKNEFSKVESIIKKYVPENERLAFLEAPLDNNPGTLLDYWEINQGPKILDLLPDDQKLKTNHRIVFQQIYQNKNDFNQYWNLLLNHHSLIPNNAVKSKNTFFYKKRSPMEAQNNFAIALEKLGQTILETPVPDWCFRTMSATQKLLADLETESNKKNKITLLNKYKKSCALSNKKAYLFLLMAGFMAGLLAASLIGLSLAFIGGVHLALAITAASVAIAAAVSAILFSMVFFLYKHQTTATKTTVLVAEVVSSGKQFINCTEDKNIALENDEFKASDDKNLGFE